MSDEKTTRCTTCRSEFTEAEIEGAKACPGCGSVGVPMAIANDIDLRINWHELRILCIWADNWARQPSVDDGARAALASIISTLTKFRPASAPALTVFGEIKELQDTFPGASMVQGGEVVIPPVSGSKDPH